MKFAHQTGFVRAPQAFIATVLLAGLLAGCGGGGGSAGTGTEQIAGADPAPTPSKFAETFGKQAFGVDGSSHTMPER
jgi:hypothetical protein